MLATVAWQVLIGNGLRLEGESVYLHIIWFAAWFGLRVETYPFGLLTMIMPLKAIFVSTS